MFTTWSKESDGKTKIFLILNRKGNIHMRYATSTLAVEVTHTSATTANNGYTLHVEASQSNSTTGNGFPQNADNTNHNCSQIWILLIIGRFRSSTSTSTSTSFNCATDLRILRGNHRHYSYSKQPFSTSFSANLVLNRTSLELIILAKVIGQFISNCLDKMQMFKGNLLF